MTVSHQNLADFISTEEARKIFNFILSKGYPAVTRQDAEDIFSEAITRAIETQQRGKAIQNPANWMYRTVRNMVNDFFRRKKTEKKRFSKTPIPLAFPAADRDNPYAHWRKTEVWQAVQAALATLSDRYYDVCFWRCILNASPAETAQTLGLTRDVVKKRLYNGKLQLRDGLQAYVLAAIAPSRCSVFARKFPDVPPVDAAKRASIAKHARQCSTCQTLSERNARLDALLSIPFLLPLPASLAELLKTAAAGAMPPQSLPAQHAKPPAGQNAPAKNRIPARPQHSGVKAAATTGKTAAGLSAGKIGLGLGALALVAAGLLGALRFAAPSFSVTPTLTAAPTPTVSPAPPAGVNYSSGNIQFGYLPAAATAYRCNQTLNAPLSLPFANQTHIKPDTLTLDCNNQTLTVTLGWKTFPPTLPAGISPPPEGTLQFEWAAWVNIAGNLPDSVDLRQIKNPPLDYKLAAEFIATPQNAANIPFDERALQATLYQVTYAPNPGGGSAPSDAFASRYTAPQVILKPLSAAAVQVDPQAGTLSFSAPAPGISPHSQVLLSTFDNIHTASFAGSMD